MHKKTIPFKKIKFLRFSVFNMSFFHKKKKGENKFPPSFLCYTAKGKRDKKSEQRPLPFTYNMSFYKTFFRVFLLFIQKIYILEKVFCHFLIY